MKLSLLRFEVLAIKPPTFTCAPPPNTTPLGLISSTCPFASSRPRIIDTCAPVTRFSVAACADGCRKRTWSPAPIPKLRQSMIARSLNCSIRVDAVPSPLMRASPARTVPPAGPCACSPVLAVPIESTIASTPFVRCDARRN